MPGFTLADMLAVLVQKGVLPRGPTAVSPGGAADSGRDMEATALEAALARAQVQGAVILRTPDLAATIAAKRAVLKGPRVLISVGGNWASAGTGEGVLGRTGLLAPGDFKPGGPGGTGLIQSCLRDGIPVIRILDVQDLCARTGLPFDPIPWSETAFRNRSLPPRALILAGPLLALLAAAWIRFGKVGQDNGASHEHRP